MKNWTLYRGSKRLGAFLCESLRREADGTVYAFNGNKKIGAVASGSNLHWRVE
jgi:hypothetical protein